MARARILAIIGLLAGAPYACNGEDNPEITHQPDGGDGASGKGGTGGAGDGGGGSSGSGDASDDFVLPDASSIPVLVGMVPVAAAPGAANETLAHLEVIAAGARAATIVRRWDGLFSSATAADTPSWQYLQGLANLYSDAGRKLLVSLAVVDRSLDARPEGVTGAWSSPATIAAGEALIDRTLATFGAELSYLAIGNEVDRFLDQASAADRDGFVVFAKSMMDYARAHPALPQGLELGVSATTDALVQPSAELDELTSASDVVIASYHAVDASFQVRLPSSAPSDLDALWAAVGGDAGKTQIVLQEVAYPSSEDSDSSLVRQKTFFDGLFVALLSRRERFPFVVVRGSNEQTQEACEADADAVGATGSPQAIAAYCSVGLHDASGDDKPAWSSVIEGLATFSSP